MYVVDARVDARVSFIEDLVLTVSKVTARAGT